MCYFIAVLLSGGQTTYLLENRTAQAPKAEASLVKYIFTVRIYVQIFAMILEDTSPKFSFAVVVVDKRQAYSEIQDVRGKDKYRV